MAKIFKNKKQGFKIIKLTADEARKIWGEYGGAGICDKCGEYQDHVHYCYYVAVLNWFMCPKCFNEWLKRAKKYREDEAFEKIQYDNIVHRLKTFGLWEE